MGVIISFYSRDAFKEFILPAEKNADHTITLRSNYFKINDDIKIQLEVLDGEWSIKKTIQYTIVHDDRQKKSTKLEDNGVLTIHTVYQEDIYLFIKYTEVTLHAYKKYVLNGIDQITIGKNPENDICYDFKNMVSREHAVISAVDDGYIIRNLSPNGVYVDSTLIMEETKLKLGAYINILGLHIVYLGDIIAIDTHDIEVVLKHELLKLMPDEGEATIYLDNRESKCEAEKITYHRAPRNYEKLESDIIEIEAPPELEQEKKRSFLMSIGPSLSMSLPMLLGCLLMVYSNSRLGGSSSLYMYSGLVMAVSSAFIGVLWTVLNQKQDKRERSEKEKYRFETYSEYLIEKTDEIKDCYKDTTRKLLETYPDANVCLRYDEKKGMLWNRNYSHDDFLTHRLGIGEKEFQYKINIPKKKFKLYKDELADKPAYVKDSYQKLIDVPITVDLFDKNLIGIVGGKNKGGSIDVARNLAVQIAANNCYVDVKLVFIYDNDSSDDNGQWDYAKWLPHVWSEDKRVRYIAASKNDASEVFYELTKIFREREEHSSGTDDNVLNKPYYVVFVSRADMLEGEGFAKYALNSNKKLGLTTIILTDRREYLPNECEFIIENSYEFKGAYNIFESKKMRQRIDFDEVDIEELNTFARHLSSLHVSETEQGGEIPNSITFFEMFGINKIQEYPVREMWAKSKTYENIRGMLGQRAGGAPCYLDVHEKYHGPHGLVAGTTGSGKSETLQTYILSLAINYSPDDVGFFIIDYKGGGMANLFEGLPHLIGSISNLSGNQVKRAMISIKSENRRRQRIFTEHGVNNINLYTKLYKNGEALLPIPHLFIVIDEFAELKREEPEFMKELISVAQVGRSLGVHLILATQKPSGTVDDNIWSNSKFRICLRVQDQQDSKDMLHKPDAAYITQAGRGYLQVGNDEIFELFQSGFSGAVYDENTVAASGDIVKLITSLGKVDMTGNSVRLSQKKHAEVIWIDKLCKVLDYVIKNEIKKIKSATDSEEKIKYIIDYMYKSFPKHEVDYEENEFNRARLRDFVSLYISLLKINNNVSKAEQIIILANMRGKKLPQPKEKTQLDVTKEYLAEVAESNGYNHTFSLWMPVLKEHIYLSEFEEFTDFCYRDGKWVKRTDAWNLQTVIGKVDDPENQSQMPLLFDFAKQGHVSIIGSVSSGKSTLMQTMLYGLINHYTPDYINIYVLDFSSRMLSAFEDAPHIGGIMYEGDEEKISKFFNMIEKIIKERKAVFKGGNYKQYVQKNGVIIPAIILFVDNYASFKEKTNQKYEEKMIQISKEGVSLGIYLVISGAGFGYADITSRVGENLETAFCIALPEKYAYGEVLHTMKIEVMPENGIKGRGLAWYGSRVLEYQVALAVSAENDYQRMEIIQDICKDMEKSWHGDFAQKIPEIPEKPIWSIFTKLPEYRKLIDSSDYLAVAYDEADAEIYSIPLKDIYCYLITGAGKTGKTNYMKAMLQAAIDKKAHIAVLDGPKKEFKIYNNKENVHYMSEEKTIFEYFRDELTPVFQRRNRVKNDMLALENDEMDIYEKMSSEQPYFIFISDLSWFIKMIYKSEHSMSGFMENLISKGRYHNIYFIAEIALNKLSEVRGYRAFEAFVEYGTGVHFGGKCNDNTIMSFEYMSYSEKTVSEKTGVGTLPGESTYKGTKKIVVPLARK